MRRDQLVAASVATVAALIVCAALLWDAPVSGAPPDARSGDSPRTPGSKVTQALAPELERTLAVSDSSDVGSKQEDSSSSSALAPSLQQQVEEIILQLRNPKVPKEGVYRVLDKVDDVSRNPAFNPDGKTLTAEQRVNLSELVNEQNTQFQNSGDVQIEAHVTASLSALKSNQYVYIEMGTNTAEHKRNISKAKESLSLRLGKERRDWRYNESFRSSTEGDSWTVLVWYTALQHPGPFETADAMVSTYLQKDKNYKRFFANIR